MTKQLKEGYQQNRGASNKDLCEIAYVEKLTANKLKALQGAMSFKKFVHKYMQTGGMAYNPDL